MTRYAQRNTIWSTIYDQLYARGTVFANHGNSTDNTEHIDRLPSDEVQDSMPIPLEFTGTKLAHEYGRVVLERSIWGASYSSYLFEYFQHLEWIISEPNNSEGHIQWIEIL